MSNGIETEIQNLKDRNARVELDKAWEVSATRRIFIATVTYFVAAAWLHVIQEDLIFLKAVIPTVGYLLSTISIPWIKRLWLGKRKSH